MTTTTTRTAAATTPTTSLAPTLQTMPVTAHEKAEWARMAQALFGKLRNRQGFRFSVAAYSHEAYGVPLREYDALMVDYRAWLCFGTLPETPASEAC
jgi:hypothetical protein